jgi:hypothetical protein
MGRALASQALLVLAPALSLLSMGLLPELSALFAKALALSVPFLVMVSVDIIPERVPER